MKRFLHRFYSIGSSNQRWITRRFTGAGLLVLAGLLASAAAGVDTNQSLAYRIFALLAVMMGISVAFGVASRLRVGVERVLPRHGSVGEPLRYELRLTNPGRRTQRDLVLFENLPDPRPTTAEFLHSREPGEERRNWVDRQFGYYRWLWLIGLKLMARPGETKAPACPPHTTLGVAAELTPLRRGVLRFDGVTVGAPDPFGLFRSLRRIALPQRVPILPKRYPVPSFALPGTRKYQPGGVALASSVGESEEFVALRDYRPGDPVRHIHWRTWARAGKPVVKEFQDEFFVRHALVLDTFGSMELHEAFEEAVAVAASFVCRLQTQESLLDLMFVGAEAFHFTMGRGLAHVEQMLEVLAGVDLRPGEPFGPLRNLVLQHAGDLSGCILILLGLDEERVELARQLQALRVPVITLIVAETARIPSLTRALAEPGAIRAHLLTTGDIEAGLRKLEAER